MGCYAIKEVAQEAKEVRETHRNLNVLEKLQQSIANLEDISLEEWLNKLEREIIVTIKANRERKEKQI